MDRRDQSVIYFFLSVGAKWRDRFEKMSDVRALFDHVSDGQGSARAERYSTKPSEVGVKAGLHNFSTTLCYNSDNDNLKETLL